MFRTEQRANRQWSKLRKMYESMQPKGACTPGESIRREEESGKGVRRVAGLLVTSPREIASAISRGEAKPLHHVKVARHRRGTKGSAVGPPPALAPRARAHPSVTPRQLVTYDTS